MKFQSKFRNLSIKNAISRPNLDENLSEFREHAQKCLNLVKIPGNLQNFEKIL